MTDERTKENPQLSTLHRQRGQLKRKITDFQSFLSALQGKDNITLANAKQLEDRLEKITPVLEQLDNIHCQICSISNKTDDEDDKYMTDLENIYFHITSEAKALLVQFHLPTQVAPVAPSVRSIHRSNDNVSPDNVSQSNSNIGMLNNLKLPTISLPKFNGQYTRWLEFHDTFSSLIHGNESLSAVQKFHYLRASLEGDAADIIKSLQMSSSNYDVAWGLLCDRYTNRKLLIQNHLSDLFKLKPLNKDSASQLREMSDTITKNLRALDTLGQPIDQWDSIIVYLATSKFDKQTARDWELHKIADDLPTLEELQAFLTSRADVLDNINMCHGDSKHQRDFKGSRPNKSFLVSTGTCYYCDGAHAIYNCDKFLRLSIQERINKVKSLKLCSNCLRQHGDKNCYLRGRGCRKCKQNHNTLLHIPSAERPQASTEPSNQPNINNIVPLTACVANHSSQILLATAMVGIMDKQGNWQSCRALLDCASQSNFITSDLQRKLGIDTSRVSISIQGINQVVSSIKSQCEARIRSNTKSFTANLKCLVIDKISDDIPSCHINPEQLCLPENLQLADPSYDVPNKVDLLIGAQLFWSLITPGQVKLGKTLPVLQNTHLGWILSGPINLSLKNQVSQCFFSRTSDIQQQLQKFWLLEECPLIKPLSLEEQQCELDFQHNVRKDETGRFIVSIPLKNPPEKLGESRSTALRRFQRLEKRLLSKPSLREPYIKFMDEYLTLNHMSQIDNPDDTVPHFYMPHHGVINEGSLTTKLRVVFDGSCQTSTGVSFNDIQMVGPTLQSDLFTILIRFRQHPVAFSVDVEKMYRQVLLNSNQRCFQRILWRKDPLDPVTTFELNTVTYGTSSAAYLATRCLIEIANENVEMFPEASEIIKSDSYVDDILSGANTIREAAKLCTEISTILGQARFKLHKWVSNKKQIFEELGLENSSTDTICIGSGDMTKTLGLYWLPSSDTLKFQVSCSPPESVITKRKILSSISQVFDPLGLLSACTIIGKTILQLLWQENLNWDDPVPTYIAEKWNRFKKHLPLLSEIDIPRHILCHIPSSIDIHGFSDASENAYCACIYSKSISADGSTQVSLVCAKSKVAPLKKVTIPRLELCGAHLLAKLMTAVRRSLRVKFDKIYLWSDSSIVLGWLNTSPSILKVFVSHRVADIQSRCQDCVWLHVPSSDNPADLGSRGIFPLQLKDSVLWWQGPIWLTLDEHHWPSQSLSGHQPDLLPEVKKTDVCLSLSVITRPLIQFGRFSNLNRLIRATAYMFRFLNNCRPNKLPRCSGLLSLEEINYALSHIIKAVQRECFEQQIILLQNNNNLSRKDKIISFNPFVDNQGILRVGGRLNASNVAYEQKHPILLPKHYFTKLIFKNEHIRLSHAGPQLLLSSIRDRYWPLGGRNYAKSVVHECIKCFRCKPRNNNPQMGILPVDRVVQSLPFNIVGTDYAGPLLIKNKLGRGGKISKCYVAIFICFTTKAVHIELVSDLGTEAFLACLKRFIARRGKPSKIYSDNGRNFVGADNDLKQVIESLKSSKNISEWLTIEGIQWSFIPPNSPHFGGLWEAGVKSIKFHLKRVAGNVTLTFEQLYTLLTQIESILNSRPLTQMSTDPNDLEPVTPSHFLIGRRSTSLPEPIYLNILPNRLSNYQRIQQMLQTFWKRWSSEYLQELQQRKRWTQSSSNIKEGTMVLLKLDNSPSLCWPIGRVTSVIPGSDGVVRIVRVKTCKGEYKRAVSKVYPLPLETIDVRD